MKRYIILFISSILLFVSCSEKQDNKILVNTRWTTEDLVSSKSALEFYDNGRIVCSIDSHYYEGAYTIDNSNNITFNLSAQDEFLDIGLGRIVYYIYFLDGVAYMTEMQVKIRVVSELEDGSKDEEISSITFKKGTI